MFENINEIFEHLEFDNEKGTRFLRILTTAGVALIIFESFGGIVVFPKDLDLKDVANFFISYQVFIPILFYFLSWIFFKTLIPSILQILTKGIFELIYIKRFLPLEKKLVEEASKSDIVGVLKLISKLPSHFGIVRYNIEKWLISNDIDEVYEDVSNNAEVINSFRIEKIIFYSQMLVIYIIKLQGTIIFITSLSVVIKFAFWMMIFRELFLIFLGLVSYKLIRFIYKLLKKHPITDKIEGNASVS